MRHMFDDLEEFLTGRLVVYLWRRRVARFNRRYASWKKKTEWYDKRLEAQSSEAFHTPIWKP